MPTQEHAFDRWSDADEPSIVTGITKAKGTWIATGAALGLLRLLAVARYRIDSDEPQHLHVVWGWTHGLVPYRDVFDNHMPLFHVLTAPVLSVVGEHPETLIAMRAAMIPVFLAALWLTYAIARRCYGVAEARWATLITAAVPTFFLTSIEFRPDTLWAVCWLAAIAILIDEEMPIERRFAFAGLLMGCAFSLSLKTVLLLASLMVGIGAIARPSDRKRWPSALPFVGGIALVVAIVGSYFVWRGAANEFVNGVFGHNLIWRWKPKRLIEYPCLLTLIALASRFIDQSTADERIARRRLFLFVTAHFYGATLFCLWPLVEREHWLPYVPLAVVGSFPLLGTAPKRAVLIAAQLALIVGLGALWRDNTAHSLELIDATLRVTEPTDSVVDVKGETVFRHRAFHPVLEPITRQRISQGQLRDSIADDVVSHHAYVCVTDDRAFPSNGRRFLQENFVIVGPIRVAGRRLAPGSSTFTVVIPGRYAIIGASAGRALIDGKPYRGPRHLEAGIHQFHFDAQSTLTLLWANAIERGLWRPST